MNYVPEPDRFTITEDHLKLIKEFYIGWNDFAYEGAPGVDIKRPYGNSDVYEDVCRHLGFEPLDDPDEEFSNEQLEAAKIIHEETATALQICTSLLKFETGTYERPEKWCTKKWIKVEN